MINKQLNNLKVFEAFSGYGSQSIALDNIGLEHDVVAISEIDPDAIIAYAAIKGCNLNEDLDVDIDTARDILKEKNVGWDFQKQKSSITRMKKDKLKKLYNADKFSKNLGDVSMIETNKVPEHDLLTYSFPCFIEGTLVLTNDGYKEIENITSEDYVLTHTNKYQKVLKPMVNKANHIYKLSAMTSEDIYVTEEHPYYVRKLERKWDNSKRRSVRIFNDPEWKKVKDLDKSYYVGSAINTKSELPKWDGIEYRGSYGHSVKKENLIELFENSNFWWLVGRFIGDGWTREYKGTQSNNSKRHDERVVICCAKEELNEITEVLNRLPLKYNVAEEKAIYKIHIVNKEFTRYLYQFGKGASNKHLTQDIINLPINLLKSFIEGYISSDGYITKNGYIKISSVSNKLIYDISQCIMKVYKRPISVYKTKRKKTCIIEGRVVNQKDTYTVAFKKEVKKQDKAFYENGYIWSPINNIEKLEYDGLVYNMEVENDNSYVVQNIIVHNCTDVSVAGKGEGLKRNSGTRSGLLWECEKIIQAKKPKFLLMENVKNLIGKKFKSDFDRWCRWLEEQGYTNYYDVLNAKRFGVPQNRERVFMISILGDHKPYEFPKGFPLRYKLKDFLEHEVEEKYYLSEEIQNRFKMKNQGSNIIGTTAPDFRTIGQRDLVYGQEGTMGALVATDYKQPKQIIEFDEELKPERLGGVFDEDDGTRHQAGSIWNKDAISPTLDTMQGGWRQPLVTEENKVIINGEEVELPTVASSRGRNPDNPSDRRAGIHLEQRLEPNISGISNTITTVHKDNYVLEIDDRQNFEFKQSGENVIGEMGGDLWEKRHEQARRVYDIDTVAPTIPTAQGGGVHPKILEGNNYRIRKLTPKECFLLMGLSLENISKIDSANISDSQKYKLAGNSIVVSCLEHIFKKLLE